MSRYLFISLLSIPLIAYYNYTSYSPRRLSESFPTDAFSDDQIRRGGFLIFILGISYILLAIREICSKYFTPAVDIIVKKFRINSDMAGATLIAVVNSSPEIFISFIGIFLANSDIGHGTVLGSGAFNGMFILGTCALTAKTHVELSWYPIFRDFSFYIIMLVLLTIFSIDLSIEWWEGMVLFLFYIVYACLMKYSKTLEKNLKKFLNLPYEGDSIEFKQLPNRSFQTRRNSIQEIKDYLPNYLDYRKGVLGKLMRNTQTINLTYEENNKEAIKKLRHVVYIILRSIEEKRRCDRRNQYSRDLIKPYDSNSYLR